MKYLTRSNSWFGEAGLTGTSSDQDWTALPVGHHGGHLDLIR